MQKILFSSDGRISSRNQRGAIMSKENHGSKDNNKCNERQMIYETIIQHGRKSCVHVAHIRVDKANNDVLNYRDNRNEFINQFRRNVDQEENNNKLRELLVSCSNDKIHRQFYDQKDLFFENLNSCGEYIKAKLGLWQEHNNFEVISQIKKNIDSDPEMDALYERLLSYKKQHHQF